MLALTATAGMLRAQQPTDRLRVTVAPATVLTERRDRMQFVNCDLTVTNTGTDRLRIWEIELDVFDSTGRLVVRKTVNSNGYQPGIVTVAPSFLRPNETIDIFNPFFWFDAGVPLYRLQYSIRYLIENTAADSTRNRHRLPFDFDVEGRLTVIPHAYADKTPLILPLRGRLLVWDGHDFYSHHRRVPLHDPRVVQFGTRANYNRFAIDLIAVDAEGNTHKGTAYNKENWFTYGMPVYAPGAGRVVASANHVPDNWFEGSRLRTPDVPDSDLVEGNFVLIDHGNGEYSIFPHMKPGSVRVSAGDTVRQGQMIGQVGFSGDAIFPHVHYSLVNAAHLMSADGVPIYFQRFRRLLGVTSTTEQNAPVDSGDIIESTANYGGGN
jgi:hypothetical protein